MGIISKSKSENWGMGFLLVFFPEDQPPLPLASARSSSSLRSTLTPLRRTASNPLITKAQSTISICFLLFVLSLLLFSLSPLPTTNHLTPRRHLLSSQSEVTNLPSLALQKLGVLHRRGTRGMHDLVVGHVTESLSTDDFRLFIRLFHFSNLNSKSDLVLIFPSKLNNFENIISEEIKLFSKSNSTKFMKLSKKEKELGEPIWGKKSRTNYTNHELTQSTESTRTSYVSNSMADSKNSRNYTENASTKSTESESTQPTYGSVVSFVADELDPENSLSGFLDHIDMGMRRWACYPMLLGRVRRNFKHIILVDMKDMFLLGDPLGRVRTRSPEWVQLTTESTLASKHGTGLVTRKRVNSGLVLGGSRGVRRLANTMLTEVVRAATATQHKRKNSVTESAILNQLAGNDHVLKSGNVNVFTESVPDVSSLGRIGSNLGSGMGLGNYSVVRRGNGNLDVNDVIRKHICLLLKVNSSVYSDC